MKTPDPELQVPVDVARQAVARMLSEGSASGM
jgi:hypothetical protein